MRKTGLVIRINFTNPLAKIVERFVEVAKSVFRGRERFPSEINNRSVMRTGKKITVGKRRITLVNQIAEGVEIAKRFGHLLAVDKEPLIVKPVFDEGFSRRALRLGDFIFVVRENKINPAGVNVKTLAKMFHRHGGTLDMPAGPALAPRREPKNIAVIFGPRFPEGKVFDIFL